LPARPEPTSPEPAAPESLASHSGVPIVLHPLALIPPAQRPRVVLRYANNNELLVSGLLDGGVELAQRPAIVDSPFGQGHVLTYSNNPFWRAETKGSYFLVFNALLNFDNLDAGRKLAAR